MTRTDNNRQPRRVLSVVVPCYNEEEVVEAFYRALKTVLVSLSNLRHEIVFVDDGSNDETLALLNRLADDDPAVSVYSLSRNFGHQVALTAGIDAVSETHAVILMDGDLQHPPSMVVSMVRLWIEGYDVVSAVRRSTAKASFFKRITSRCFYWLVNQISDTRMTPGAADFCLLSSRACAALRAMPERHRFLRGMVSWIGFKRAFLPFEAPPRAAGQSKYTVWKMVQLALDATFSFSSIPLRLATRLGVIIVGGGVGYLAYAIVRYFAVGDLVPGWGSLISTLLILGGTQLVFLGLIGEYLSRVFEESKGRPLYFLKQTPNIRDSSTPDQLVTTSPQRHEGESHFQTA